MAKTHGVPVSRVLWRLGFRPNAPPFLLFLWHLVRYREIRKEPPLLSNFPLAPGLVKRTRLLERAREQILAANKPATLREGHSRAFTAGLTSFIFEVMDQLSCDYLLATRQPFYDRRLVELCLSLPHVQKLSGGWTRMVLRRAMEGILPIENQWRPDKSNISPHFYYKLRGQERSLLLQTLVQVSPLIADYTDIKKLKDLSTSFLSNKQRNDLWLPVWMAMSLGVFMLERPCQSLWKGGSSENTTRYERVA